MESELGSFFDLNGAEVEQPEAPEAPETPETPDGARIIPFPTRHQGRDEPLAPAAELDALPMDPAPSPRVAPQGLRRRLLSFASAERPAGSTPASHTVPAPEAQPPRRRWPLGPQRLGSRDDPVEPAASDGPVSVVRLADWLEGMRRDGLAFVYWNAAKIGIDLASVRVARLADDAEVQINGHRVLVVEPLRRPSASASTCPPPGGNEGSS
ncbi:MAG: hypothetical protein ACRDJN_10965 [Chloroflexota bacterium]